MPRGRFTTYLFGTFVVCFLLLIGSIGVFSGIRCTIHGRVFLGKGRPAQMSQGVSRVSDRTRLYGPGLILFSVSALAAAVALPFVPLHPRHTTPRSRRSRTREKFTLTWRIIGYGMGIGLLLVGIAAVGSVR